MDGGGGVGKGCERGCLNAREEQSDGSRKGVRR